MRRGSPRSVGRSKVRIGEVAHGFWTGLGERRRFDIDEALQVLGEAIDRFELTVEKVGQDELPFAFDFAGYHADGFPNELLNIRLLFAQHVDRPAGVKATYDDCDIFSAEAPGDVESSRELIGLHSH